MDKKIDMTPMLCGATDKIDFELELAIAPESLPYGVEFPEPVKAHGSITNSAGYMRLYAEEEVHFTSECARCLTAIDGRLIVEFERSVAVAGTIRDENADDYLFIEDSRLDVETPLLEQVIVEFPAKLLCREDCKGLCVGCGADLNHENCTCSQQQPLSRWAAALTKIRDQLDEQN